MGFNYILSANQAFKIEESCRGVWVGLSKFFDPNRLKRSNLTQPII